MHKAMANLSGSVVDDALNNSPTGENVSVALTESDLA